jgi:hypothetical protein
MYTSSIQFFRIRIKLFYVFTHLFFSDGSKKKKNLEATVCLFFSMISVFQSQAVHLYIMWTSLQSFSVPFFEENPGGDFQFLFGNFS